MTTQTRPYDPARYLDGEDEIREFLAAMCEDGSPEDIARALGVVARARGMSELARRTGLTRQTLYKALSGNGNPTFATITKVAEALGLRVTVTAVRSESDAA